MFAADVAAEICGDDQVNRNVLPSLGGEDFSYMLRAVPGAMVWLGNGSGEGGCFLHNARYDFNDSALPYGVSFFVRLAGRLSDPHPFVAVAHEHEDHGDQILIAEP